MSIGSGLGNGATGAHLRPETGVQQFAIFRIFCMQGKELVCLAIIRMTFDLLRVRSLRRFQVLEFGFIDAPDRCGYSGQSARFFIFLDRFLPGCFEFESYPRIW